MFFCALLVPFSIFSNGNNENNYTIEQRIQALNSERLDKLLLISDLGKKIAEQEQLIESMIFKMSDVWQRLLEPLNDQEKKLFNEEISAFAEHTNQVSLGEKDSKQFLIKELFKNPKGNYALGRIKSWQIRIEVEWDIWKNLFENYEKCLLDLFQILRKLDDLKKQPLHN
jgi:hypothetical protein